MNTAKRWVEWTLEAIGRCGILYVAEEATSGEYFAWGWKAPANERSAGS